MGGRIIIINGGTLLLMGRHIISINEGHRDVIINGGHINNIDGGHIIINEGAQSCYY